MRGVVGFNADLLIAGSPCQSFSIAGNGLGFDGKSGLFYEFLRVLKECQAVNPNIKFLLENVKMRKEWSDKISELLGVAPVEINSCLVSAQNRKRLYWTNIPQGPPPEDCGIILRDILEDGFVDRQKSFCLDASYHKGGNLEQYFEKSRRQLVFDRPVQINPDTSCGGNQPSIQNRIYIDSGKSPAVTSVTALIYSPKYLGPEELERLRKACEGKTWKSGNKMGKMRVPHPVEGKAKCLVTSQTARETNYIFDKIGIRKLTPIECERLQTLPDNYTEGVSTTQRYRSLGNGWTVDVIAHLFKNL